MQPLSRARAQFLENAASEIGPQAFEALSTRSPTWLIEVACSPESLLSAEVQKQAGYEGAAEKRRHALKQYLGACSVYHHCMQLGIHATWEWAQKCHAWRLPFMQKMDKRYVPYYAVTQGCQVGLRDPKSGRLMHKGWKIMTSHARLAEHMSMPCACSQGQTHAKCEGGLASASAFYTPDYVRRLVHVIRLELSRESLVREMEGQTSLLQSFGKGQVCMCHEVNTHGSEHVCGACATLGSPLSETEASCMASGLTGQLSDEEIRRKLYLLHAATGHTSYRNMLEALKKRNAPKRVLELAETFERSVCAEKRKLQTRHVASLEILPPKLATVSADGGKWVHPESKEEIEFVCAIDEGSRFRVAKVLKRGRKQTMSASEFLQFLEEHWVQYFGVPQSLRLDPSGAFRSREVDQYCEARGIYLDVIAGEAHWQLGTCEQAIRGLKEGHDQGC